MDERKFATIAVDTAGAVRSITLRRPERKNAISLEMANELVYALDDARDDPSVRAIVLRGEGAAFCAGGDLGSIPTHPDALPFRGDFSDLLLRFSQLGKPTVARVHGVVMGGGLGLVASCDFAIAEENTVFGAPEIKRGLFPFIVMAVLGRVVPRRQLLSMMLLGEKFSAREALAMGLVGTVVSAEALDETVAALAGKLSSLPREVTRMGLSAYHRQADLALAESLPFLRDQLAAALGTADAQEGVAAFLEKRTPRF